MHLTSKQAARLLAVSEASVKRWADNGSLPTLKTAGGHRRFRPSDIAVFRQQTMPETGRSATRGGAPIGLPRSASRGLPALKSVSESLYEYLVAGEKDETASLLIRLHLEGISVATLADEVLCPAMRQVGDLWHQGTLSVAEEHVASRAALEALSSLRSTIRRVDHGVRALCCATEDDFHEMPVQIAALTLEASGWDVINLGTSTPFYSVAEAVGRFSPRLVCIASTLLEGLDRGTREFADLRKIAQRKGTVMALGGAGFTDVALRFPAELHAANFKQLENFAASIKEQEVSERSEIRR